MLDAPRGLRPRYESLDLWRGVACLMVIVYHSTIVYRSLDAGTLRTGLAAAADWVIEQCHSLNAGVALFFVISGYCIAAAAVATRARGRGISEYFFHRFRRIYPPFWVVVACSALFFAFDLWPVRGLLSDSPWEQLRPWWYFPSQWIGNLTLTETWRPHVFGAGRGHFPGQAWTLCYEEQFYAVTGLLLILRPSAFFPALTVITGGTVALTLFTPAAPFVNGFFFDGSWLLFASGVAVYYRLHHANTGVRWALDVVLVSAVPLSLLMHVPIAGTTLAFAFAALLPWLHSYDPSVMTRRGLRPLFFSGRICYSLYLVHQIPVKAVTAAFYRAGVTGPVATLFVVVPISVAVAIALGSAFHVLVERHFLNPSPGLADRPSPSPRELVAAVQ